MSNPNPFATPAATRPRTEQDPRASRHNETAARHAVADVPRARPDQTVAEVLDALLAQPSECIDLVCVLDAGDHLVGVVPLAALLALPRDTRVGQIANLHFPKVHAETDQERVASLALHHELSAIPVTDAQGRAWIHGLQPWEENVIGISPDALPMDMLVSVPENASETQVAERQARAPVRALVQRGGQCAIAQAPQHQPGGFVKGVGGAMAKADLSLGEPGGRLFYQFEDGHFSSLSSVCR